MSLTEAASVFVVFLLSVSVVQGHNDWSVTCTPAQICAVKGSTVKMHCKYTKKQHSHNAAAEKPVCYTKLYGEPVDLETDRDYTGRVECSCDWETCTLTITNLKISDSAVYYIGFLRNRRSVRYFNEPGVTLSVKDLQVQVVQAAPYDTWLKCHSSCLHSYSEYVWYKNGKKIPLKTSNLYFGYLSHTDSYSCALSGHEDSHSPSVCVHGESCNRVTYTDRSICAFKGSSVDISCTYNSYEGNIESKFWFRAKRSQQPVDLSEDPQYSDRVQVLETQTGRSTLRITDLRESDSAQYHFRFTSGRFKWESSLPGTTLTVTDIQVVLSGSKLKCETTCQLLHGSSYVWFKNGQKIHGESSYFYSASYDQKNSYSCAVEGLENFPSSPVCGSGQSCNRVIYTHRKICAPKGSSVDISCRYNNYERNIDSKFWFTTEQIHGHLLEPWGLHRDIRFSRHVDVFERQTRNSTLRISDLTESDSAQYHFKFSTWSFEWKSTLPGTTLTVTALQVQVTRIITVYESYTEAELNCHSICRPMDQFSYIWFKSGWKIQGETSSYIRTHVYPEDNISCAFKGYEGYPSASVYLPKVALEVVSPSDEIVEGSLVILTCSSDANPAANYTWYKKSQTLTSEEPQLVFNSIQSSDSGEYFCTAENELGRRTENIFINVNYAPKTNTVLVNPTGDIVEGSSVTLTCKSDANPAANYTWYKGNQTVLQGQEGIYNLISITPEDSGIYHCKSVNQYGQLNTSSLFLDVQYAPKLLSVSVSPSGEIVEGSSVTLTCSSDANPAANYTWYKENEDSPKASGQIFTITDFRAEHSGNYYCVSWNRRGHHNSTIHLTVMASSVKSAASGLIIIFLALILLLAFVFIRKRFLKEPPEPGERPDRNAQLNEGPEYESPPAAVQRAPAELQDQLFYASVSFSKNQEDPVYSNIKSALPNRHKTEDGEGVEYTVVNVKHGIASPRCQEAVEDPSALYSTVSKRV